MACRCGRTMALLVGCNYPNTIYELKGGYNDVNVMHKIITGTFGFDNRNIEILMDKPGTKPEKMPTGRNIKNALRRLISQLRFGDVLFFFFSGHGTRITSAMSHTKFVEAIVPSDYNIITSMDFRALVDRVPSGATLTLLCDSSYSGGLLEKEKDQLGPVTTPIHHLRSFNPEGYCKAKLISQEALLGGDQPLMRSAINIPPRDLKTTMLQKFGSEASLLFTETHNLLTRGVIRNDQGILLSACQADERAMDYELHGQYMGAFTRAVQVIIQERLLQRPFTNKELVVKAREILPTKILKDYPSQSQHPGLYCSDENANHRFLSNLPKKGCPCCS